MAVHTERWRAGEFSVVEAAGQGWGCEPFLWNHTSDSAPRTWHVLCVGNYSRRFYLSAAAQLPSISPLLPASVSRDGRKCSPHSPRLPDVLFPPLLWPKCSHLPKVNETGTWTKLKLILFFFFPFWINFKSCLLFYPIHQVPAQMLLPAQRRWQLRWGNEWLRAVQEKRERHLFQWQRQLVLCWSCCETTAKSPTVIIMSG